MSAPRLDASARPLQVLAQRLRALRERLGPAQPGAAPTPGDRLEALGSAPGPLGDGARALVEGLYRALRGLEQGLTALDPWLTQLDVVVALAGVVAAALEGGQGAAAGLASLGVYATGEEERPDVLYRRLDDSRRLPAFKAVFDSVEAKTLILPPPEDLAAALSALAPLLHPNPPAGERSLPTLLRALGRSVP